MSKSQMKIMFIITFYDIGCIVHFEFFPQAYFVEILKRLREAVRTKGPELRPNDWIFHHDSPAH